MQFHSEKKGQQFFRYFCYSIIAETTYPHVHDTGPEGSHGVHIRGKEFSGAKVTNPSYPFCFGVVKSQSHNHLTFKPPSV